jgi:lipopolysaccharide transport system permease protein
MNQSTEIVIKPQRGWIPLNLGDMWEFRGLLYFLTWRDVKVKYKQSLLGVAWVIFRPLISMAIFSVLFGRVAKFPSEGVPYPVFVFVGLLPWLYFSTSISQSTTSLVSNVNLISKIYFPRILIPISANFANIFDFMVSLSILVLIMFYYGVALTPAIFLAPLIFVAIFMTALGPGILCGTLNVRYRDVGHIIPFLVQIWMFITPVVYPVSFIPERFRPLMYLNPMTGPIEAFRASLLGTGPINVNGFLTSLGVGAAVFIFSLYYFRRVERTFADVI